MKIGIISLFKKNMNMKYQSLYLLFFLGHTVYLGAQEIYEKYHTFVHIYSTYNPESQVSETSLLEICYALHGQPIKHFVKQLSSDIKRARKLKLDASYIKRLHAISKFIRAHMQFFKTYAYHKELQKKYAFAFDNPCVVQNVLEQYSAKFPLHAFMRELQSDLAKLERHEDKLHSKYGYLKSHNHALKIELIKIRNSIIYQDIYKEQCSAYARKNWWKAPYKVVEGICVGSYCVGSYMWTAVAG